MHKWMFLAAIAASQISYADDMSKTCLVQECAPGSKAVTFSAKDDYYFSCPTSELSEYTNTVLGLISVSSQIGGKLPNISPVTGEPEFQGETKDLVDSLRLATGVSTYDQALAQCARGTNKKSVMVMNNPKDGGSIWVAGQDQKPFWMPKGFLSKR